MNSKLSEASCCKLRSLSIVFNTDLSLVLRDVKRVALLLIPCSALLLVVGWAFLLLHRLVVGLEDGLTLGQVPVVSEPRGPTKQSVQDIQDIQERGGCGEREEGQEADRGEEVHLGVGVVWNL